MLQQARAELPAMHQHKQRAICMSTKPGPVAVTTTAGKQSQRESSAVWLGGSGMCWMHCNGVYLFARPQRRGTSLLRHCCSSLASRLLGGRPMACRAMLIRHEAAYQVDGPRGHPAHVQQYWQPPTPATCRRSIRPGSAECTASHAVSMILVGQHGNGATPSHHTETRWHTTCLRRRTVALQERLVRW